MLEMLLREARDALSKELGTKETEALAAACDEHDLHGRQKLSYWIGYLRGSSEAQDMTITELLESL